ncbi:MAG: penicillin-binding protein 2 [bacterium]
MDRENQSRLFIGMLFVVFVVLFGRLWQLQVLDYSTYSTLSKENTTRTIPALAPRGIIYDRYGNVIVANRAIFSAYLFPSSFDDEDELNKVLSSVSRMVGIPQEKILKKINENKSRPFEPILIKDDLSIKTVTALEERQRDLPGIVINVRPVRYYPYKNLAAHVLGYVGEITKEELGHLREQGYNLKDNIGKEGIEITYDKYLRGVDGGQQLEIDVSGRLVRTVGVFDPVPGSDIKLTLDLELQKVVEKNLEGKRGAVIVMDPRNGEILAMASQPSYDPNIFAAPLDKREWERMDREGHPFLNRALSTYPPGSTFKVVTLSATLQEGTASLDEIFECKGYYILGNRKALCWISEYPQKEHGKLNILEGLVHSCDVVFYELGLRNGPTLLSKYSKVYGLGARTGIDLPGELSGVVPTEEWKKKVYKDVWVKGDSINFGIGQGFLIVTPIQMANVYGTIAAGKRFVPHVALDVRSRDGKEIFKYKPATIGGIPLSPENTDLLKATMREVVIRGTGIAAEVKDMPAAGKTGTAENPGKPHAWFMCFAPYTSPEVVVISFVEHGEHGDRVTAYIAREILKWYRDNVYNKEKAKAG